MTERLLQYIWQFHYFTQASLSTIAGEQLQVIHPGTYNTQQGPDFKEARIRVGTTTWAGNIELHLNSSDWQKHKHSADRNYQNVILHVVWQHDIKFELPFPTLELHDRISSLLIDRYDELMNQTSFIPCEKNIRQVDELSWTSWKERLLVERLQFRSQLAFRWLEENNYHWEETFWWMLARNFGIPQNADIFEKIAQSIPVNILSKHKNQLQQIEALLFGQAGLLENEFSESYPALLKREYHFYQSKYDLNPLQYRLFFLRMRPANFPTLRLAQLAMLVHESSHLFAKINEAASAKEIKELLNVTANDYWHYHYIFDELSSFRKKTLGEQMVNNIIINTVAPMLFTYGQYHMEDAFKEKAISLLEQLPVEKNKICDGFARLGIKNQTAFDSQALIQLKNEYCDKKRCLDCMIGAKLLKQGGY